MNRYSKNFDNLISNYSKPKNKVKKVWQLISISFVVYQKALVKPRDILLKVFLYLSVIIIIVAGITNAFVGNIGKSIVSILLGIFCSVLAAVFFEIITRLRDEFDFLFLQKKFMELFAIEGENDEIYIVLPKYNNSILEKFINGKPIIQYKDDEAHKNIATSSKFFVALADLKCAMSISSLFEKLKLKQPQTISDDEALLKLHSDSSDKKTFFSVGLFSNELTIWANKTENIGRLFKIYPGEKYIQLASFENRKLLDENNWQQDDIVSINQNEDVLIVTKVKFKNNVINIIGGFKDFATEKAGMLLKDSWKEEILYYVTHDQVNDIKLNDSPDSCFIALHKYNHIENKTRRSKSKML